MLYRAWRTLKDSQPPARSKALWAVHREETLSRSGVPVEADIFATFVMCSTRKIRHGKKEGKE
jgi:hypothetical protein